MFRLFFLQTLRYCDVKPYVIFDGAYAVDDRKLKTVLKRARDKIFQSDAIARGRFGRLVSPLAHDVFKNVLTELNIPHVTCPFEADGQIAALANAWRCPVMSNDSDFFIFDLIGGFILFDYVNLQVSSGECETTSGSDKSTEKCKYLNVQIYFTQNLVDLFPNLDKSMLPLFACLYGNDTVQRTHFEAFYSQAKFPAVSSLPAVWSSPGKKHDKILKLLMWLDVVGSREVAVETVLRHVAAAKRFNVQTVRKLVHNAIESYSIEEDFLGRYFETGAMQWLDSGYTATSSSGSLGPLWFAKGVCQAEISTFMLNVFLLRRALLRCQMEDMKSPSAYRCALPLRRVTYSVVCQTVSSRNQHLVENKRRLENNQSGSVSGKSDGNQSGYVTEYDREGKEYRSFKVELLSSLPSRRLIPDLDHIAGLSHTEKLKLISDAFGINELEVVCGLSENWRFLVLTVVYWIRNASPKVNVLHLYSLLTCVVKLSIDSHLEVSALGSVKTGRHCVLEEELKKCPVEVLKEAQTSLQRFCREPSASTQFYVQNVHAFAQYQAVYLAALQLNSTLQNVLVVPCPSRVFNGTLLYNMYKELHARKEPKLYVDQLFVRSGPLVPLVDQIIETITRFLVSDGGFAATPGLSSKKTRKRKGEVARSGGSFGASRDKIADEDTGADRTEDAEHLAGNQFALLAIN